MIFKCEVFFDLQRVLNIDSILILYFLKLLLKYITAGILFWKFCCFILFKNSFSFMASLLWNFLGQGLNPSLSCGNASSFTTHSLGQLLNLRLHSDQSHCIQILNSLHHSENSCCFKERKINHIIIWILKCN